MTAEAAQREPTMEEILASIRKIISEDEVAGEEAMDLGTAAEEAPAEEPAPVEAVEEPVAAEPEPAAEPEVPGVDLSAFEADPEPEAEPAAEAVAEEPAVEEPVDDGSDVMFVEQEDEPVAPEPEPAPSLPVSDDGIVADAAAQQTAGALGKLMGSMMVSSGNTLDDVVRELLRPMLKEWLDANLPTLVEAEVSRELDRIRRMAR